VRKTLYRLIIIFFGVVDILAGGMLKLKSLHNFLNVFGIRYYLRVARILSTWKKVTIISYHSVCNSSADPFAITTDSFYRQIDFLRQNYEIIRLNQIAHAFEDQTAMNRKVIITFDDAYQNFLEYALPILQKLSVPCTLFVPTRFIGESNAWDSEKTFMPSMRILNSEDLLALSREGLVDFGAHTKNHLSMRGLPVSKMREEAADSKRDLEELLGIPIDMFAYPYGQLRDMSELTAQILSEVGYHIAVTSHWGTLNSPREVLKLRRIFFQELDDPDDLKAKIEGDYDWITLKEKTGFALFQFKKFLEGNQ
jgi:peptidoglycan/xylan/chitin deacetylase (PgdA/CDA1 family)